MKSFPLWGKEKGRVGRRRVFSLLRYRGGGKRGVYIITVWRKEVNQKKGGGGGLWSFRYQENGRLLATKRRKEKKRKSIKKGECVQIHPTPKKKKFFFLLGRVPKEIFFFCKTKEEGEKKQNADWSQGGGEKKNEANLFFGGKKRKCALRREGKKQLGEVYTPSGKKGGDKGDWDRKREITRARRGGKKGRSHRLMEREEGGKKERSLQKGKGEGVLVVSGIKRKRRGTDGRKRKTQKKEGKKNA